MPSTSVLDAYPSNVNLNLCGPKPDDARHPAEGQKVQRFREHSEARRPIVGHSVWEIG
jgi:hypothetical protein